MKKKIFNKFKIEKSKGILVYNRSLKFYYYCTFNFIIIRFDYSIKFLIINYNILIIFDIYIYNIFFI